MSLFTESSLCLVPSGVKDGKVYSIKPTDGSGDLTFTRSNDTATRVASNGLIERVRTNLLTYSQAFTNAAWSKTNVSVTGGQTDPNGGNTASLVETTVASSTYFFQTQAGAKCFSVYAKAGTSSVFSIINGLYNQGAGFNLSTQSATAAGAGSLAKIEDVGGGWFRCSVYMSSATEIIIMLADVSGGGMVVGNNLTFAFAQAETGDIATDYIATTSAAVSVGPVANLPRLDYSGGATCPSLLLEPQRTNLAQYSEQFNNAWWAASNSTISSNAVVSPDGYTNADNIVENTANSTHGVGNLSGLTLTAAAYTFSVFVKKQTRNFFAISTYDGSTTLEGYFNINTGAVATMPAGLTGSIVSYGNGWYRCSVTRTMGANANNYFAFNAAPTDGGSTYTGTSAIACSLYGATIELGAYATSYIPTLSAAVTRGSDFANKGSISSLFGATEGTFFCELTYTNTNSIPIFLQSSVSSSFNQATYLQLGGNKVTYNVYNGGAQQVGITSASNFTEGQSLKIAIVYKADDFAMYINGVAQGSVSSGSISNSLTAIQIGRWNDAGATFQYFGRLNQALLFPTRLSNADLATLTA